MPVVVGPNYALCRLCCKSPSWASDPQMLSIHLKWDFFRRRPEECDSSKKANQNQDSIRGSTPNVKEGVGRLLQQNRPKHGVSKCNNPCRQRIELQLSIGEGSLHEALTIGHPANRSS